MKTILHLVDSLSVGGAEKLLAGIVNDLGDYDQHLVILEGPEDLKDTIKTNFHFTNLNTPAGWAGYWQAARKVKKIYQGQSYFHRAFTFVQVKRGCPACNSQ